MWHKSTLLKFWIVRPISLGHLGLLVIFRTQWSNCESKQMCHRCIFLWQSGIPVQRKFWDSWRLQIITCRQLAMVVLEWKLTSSLCDEFLKCTSYQWLKCNGTQGNAVLSPPIYGSKRSPSSDCHNARERHMTIVRGPNLLVAFPRL